MVRIFIAHSSKDEWLINPIASNLELIPVEPYLAKLEDPTPHPLPPKLDRAIDSSTAMFVFLTSSVASDEDTWDIINWEISSAYAKKKPVYVFREKGVKVPLMVQYITVWATYDPLNQEDLNEMVKKVQGIGSAFKEAEDKAKAASTMVMVFLGIVGLGLLFGALSGE